MRKVFIALLGALLLLLASQSYSEEYSRMFVRHEKNPGTAFLYSLVIPGLGQMYNGEVAKGFAILGAETFLIVGGSLLAVLSGEITIFAVTGIAGGCIKLYSLIDAPISANAINRKMWQGLGLLGSDTHLALQLNPAQKGIGISLVF